MTDPCSWRLEVSHAAQTWCFEFSPSGWTKVCYNKIKNVMKSKPMIAVKTFNPIWHGEFLPSKPLKIGRDLLFLSRTKYDSQMFANVIFLLLASSYIKGTNQVFYWYAWCILFLHAVNAFFAFFYFPLK